MAQVTRIVTAVLCAVAGGAATAFAQPAPPVLTAPVNDFARIIDESSRQELDRRIRALKSDEFRSDWESYQESSGTGEATLGEHIRFKG